MFCSSLVASLDPLFSNSGESLELCSSSWLSEVSSEHEVDPAFQIRAIGQHVFIQPFKLLSLIPSDMLK